jgi:hypothetical protein
MTCFLNDQLVEEWVALQEILREVDVPKVFKENALGVSTNTPLMLFAFFLLSSPGSVLAVDQVGIAEILTPRQAATAVQNVGTLFTNPLNTISAFKDIKVFFDPTVSTLHKSILGGKYLCCASALTSALTLANIQYILPVRALATCTQMPRGSAQGAHAVPRRW